MKWLVFILLLIIISIVILLFQIALKIRLVINSDISELNITFLWLSPLIKAVIKLENTTPVLHFYLFNKEIFKKTLRKGKSKNKRVNIVQIAKPEDVHVNIQYGFKDPYKTGIACGAFNIATQFINIDYMNQTPDFIAANDYIYLDATAKVNLGSTIINLFKSKK